MTFKVGDRVLVDEYLHREPGIIVSRGLIQGNYHVRIGLDIYVYNEQHIRMAPPPNGVQYMLAVLDD